MRMGACAVSRSAIAAFDLLQPGTGPLRLDAVALGIVQVDRWALAFGAVARGLVAAADAVGGEMLGDRAASNGSTRRAR